jgi:DNA-binding transcriptional ArsR family regulator
MNAVLTTEAIDDLRASAAQACNLLKAMANEDRLLLMCQLVGAELNVSELETLTEIRQPTLSQQLGVLRDDGLVSTRRAGKFIYYTLSSHEVIAMMQTLHSLYCEKE